MAQLFVWEEVGIFLLSIYRMQTDYYLPRVLAIIRIITGGLFLYHGQKVFLPDQMHGYAKWLAELHYPLPAPFAYTGKATELLGGTLFNILHIYNHP